MVFSNMNHSCRSLIMSKSIQNLRQISEALNIFNARAARSTGSSSWEQKIGSPSAFVSNVSHQRQFHACSERASEGAP